MTSAIIGGLCTLLSVYLKHTLELKREAQRAAPHNSAAPHDSAAPHQIESPSPPLQLDPLASVAIPTRRSFVARSARWYEDLAVGLGTLLANMVLIIVVVGMFNLNTTEPAWENVFAFFALGAIPAYALYRIVRGLLRLVRRLLLT